MRKLLQWLCIACTAAVVIWMIQSKGLLPFDTAPLIEEKYAGWSGVLRIWVYEGWTGDSDAFAGWLNRCIALYEKGRNGVYVQAKYVDAAAITSLETSGVRPPDMLIFPPGLVDAACLAEMPALPVRTPLIHSGKNRAAPILLAGYAWAKAEGEGMAAPPDEEWRNWTAALNALNLPTSIEETPIEALPGIDLGLPATSSDSILRTPDALTMFVNGKTGASAVGYTELKKLDRLRDQGKGPDWSLTPASGFTDQVLYLGALASGTEREQLSIEFAQHLLTDECQTLLKNYGAFTVTDAFTGYPSTDPRASIEISLMGEGLTVAPAFD